MPQEEYRLPVDRLRRSCHPADFPFETTAEIDPLEEIIGQDRAVKSLEFGLDVSSVGFNVFLAGAQGTGKTTILKRILKRVFANRPVPQDVLYVHNFSDADSPRALTLPSGLGHGFKHAAREFIQDLRDRLPKAFEGKEYEVQQRRTAEGYQERKQEVLQALEGEAHDRGFEVKSTPMGFRTIPISDGKPLTQEEYQDMGQEDRETLDGKMEELQERVRDAVAEVKRGDQALKEELKDLNRQVALNVLGTMMGDLRKDFAEHAGVLEHLDALQQDILENIELFRTQEETETPIPGLRLPRQEPDFARYEVNLVVDNQALEGAPIIAETNATYNNLFGRIERRAQFGALLTDFTMIRAGSLAKANGGCLVLEIESVLRNPFVYEALKRALRNKQINIEEPAERYGLFSTQTLRPEPIPMSLKICLIGSPLYYHMLFAYDEEFREIFKVKADFDFQADRDATTEAKFGAFVARLVHAEELPHFDRTAIAAIVEESSRFVEDQEKLSLRFAQVNDLLREAAYWACQEGAELVTGEHVLRAIGEEEFRSSLARERVQDLIQREVLVVDTEGERVGEINGLAVHMLGDYLFGRPSRISANVYLGREGVINIERRVSMSHSSHDKGVLILSGFLGERFAQERPLALSASLTFEQSYGEITGDSASSTELYALLSALADVPIRQGIAVTGSVDQKGRVQAIGGANHKIEGFFEICQERGLTGNQGVIIPSANVQHLMLRSPVIAAVEQGQFHVWAVDHVDQGIEILTGISAGEQKVDGTWPKHSINGRIEERLDFLATRLMSWNRDATQPTTELVSSPESGWEPPPPPKPPDRPQE